MGGKPGSCCQRVAAVRLKLTVKGKSEDEPNSVLFVLFIPSKDKDGNDLPAGQDQQLWANAAGDLLTTLFGGSTQMPPAKGMWLNEETQEIITEEVVLVHSYARVSHANDEERLRKL